MDVLKVLILLIPTCFPYEANIMLARFKDNNITYS